MKEKSIKPSQEEQANDQIQPTSVLNKPKAPSKLKLQNHFWLSIVVALAITLVAFEWRSEMEYRIVDEGIPPEVNDFPDIVQTKHKKKIELSDPIIDVSPPTNTNEFNVVDDIHEKKFKEGLKSKESFDENKFDPDDLFGEDEIGDVNITGNPFSAPIKAESMLPLFCTCAELPTKAEQEACNNEEIQRFLHKNLRYPKREMDQGKQGVALVNYVVDEDGNITDVHVENNTELGFIKEATRVVKTLPCMKPAKQYQRNVAVRYRIPIRFVLRN